jgi:spore coat protein U-like protein
MDVVFKRAALGLPIVLGLAVMPLQGSDAGTSTASLTVGVTVVSNCKVAASTLTFANYVSGQTTNNDTTTTISYSGCMNDSLKFELNDGANPQTASRGMRNSTGGILNYQLYRNNTYSALIGSGANAVSFTAPASGTGTVTVYGRIPANQTAAAGTYSDTVGITLTF